jgi:hypothetical protein
LLFFRPPGIYKADYLEELFRRYGDVSDAPGVPNLPDWSVFHFKKIGKDLLKLLALFFTVFKLGYVKNPMKEVSFLALFYLLLVVEI